MRVLQGGRPLSAIRLVSVPQRDVDESALALERAIDGAVAVLDEMAELRPNITPAIARLLGLTDVRQTRRMACAIVANAVTFQGRLHGIHDGVKSLRQTAGEQIDNPQRETLAAWDDILKINYWPIFAVARDIVEQLPADAASRILRRLMLTAESINAAGAHIAHDLTGRVFQRLIADRKYLATFYTLPASAALLARLAVAGMDGVDWSDPDAIDALRIARLRLRRRRAALRRVRANRAAPRTGRRRRGATAWCAGRPKAGATSPASMAAKRGPRGRSWWSNRNVTDCYCAGCHRGCGRGRGCGILLPSSRPGR